MGQLAARPLVRLLHIGTTAAVYVGTSLLSLKVAYALSDIRLCALWPAAAVAAVCVWHWRWAGILGVLLGSLVANALIGGMHPGLALGIAMGSTLAAALAAWLLRSTGFDPAMGRVRDAMLILTASLSGLVAGINGATWLSLGGNQRGWFGMMQTWSIGDALGFLACAPALFTLGRMRALRPPLWEVIGLAVSTTGCAVLVYLVLEPRLGVTGPALFLIFPPMLWAALRLGAPGAAWAMLLVALVAFAGAAMGSGVFVPGADRDGRLASFQAFLAALSLTFVVVGAAMDEIRAANARTLAAGRMEAVGRMAGGIAHDFNNLLAVVMGSAELVRRHLPADADRRPIDRILSAASRGADLTGQMLAFSRGQPMELVIVDLAGLVRASEDLIQGIVSSRPASHGPNPPPIVVRMQISDAVMRIRGEGIHLGQVLMNLVANARDAMPQGGTLTIAVERGNAHGVRLVVTDTGEGMDENTRVRIFEPYFTTKARGHGLGLATVHGIIAQHGGKIEVESRSGLGTRFIVSIPEVVAEPVAEQPIPAVVRSGQRILVVDDQPEIVVMVTAMVSVAERTVRTAGDVATARSALAAGAVDLLITDWRLPDGTGGDLITDLAGRGPVSVVVITGFAEPDLAIPVGVVVLAKPFTKAELEAAITRAEGLRLSR